MSLSNSNTSPSFTRRVAALLSLLVLVCGASRVAGQARVRPNILFISNEDMSPHLGAYGDAVARTPNLDRLATESVRFTSAFTTAPVCAPSRAAIMTGMYQNAIGAQHMRTSFGAVAEAPWPYEAVPPFYVKAFPEYLRAAGYWTSNNVKTDYQFGNPFTIWDAISDTSDWRQRPDKDQPFFSVINLVVTHESRTFPDSPARRGKPLVTDPAKVRVPPYYPDTPKVRQELARFYDDIADMDTQVGEILKRLEEDGLADNTIVFYWADHGDGLPRAKRALYDSGLRVPLMIRWPKGLGPAPFRAGTANDELVSFIDLAPTVLALAGVTIPGHMQGRVLVGPKAGPEPRYVFAARDRMDGEYDMRRSVRDHQFLYIRNFQPELPYVGFLPYRNQSDIMQEILRLHAEGKLTGAPALWMANHRPAEELYDVRKDPFQIHDLAADPAYAQVLERMGEVLDDHMDRIHDTGLEDEAEMVERMWPGGKQPVTAAPYILERGSKNYRAPERESAQSFSGPTEVEIYEPTQGASIGYTTEAGPNPHWKLYTGPFRLTGPVTIRAKAIRYGYKESPETRTTFTPVAP